jgi:diaminohydroxyphosphoribosylaminopyrimidine deaminase/5-amino-6-(5-phosphoribosylamino)uracil reductase
VACAVGAPEANIQGLERAGAVVLRLPADPDGRVSLKPLLEDLGARNVVNLMVEGGGTLSGSLFDDGLVDKVYVFIAPVIIGGAAASSPVAGLGIERMDQAWKIRNAASRVVGADWLVVGYPAAEG